MTREAVRHHKRSCGRKIGFLSQRAAAEYARSIARRHGLPDTWFDVYVCEYCGAHHIGHHKERKERSEERQVMSGD